MQRKVASLEDLYEDDSKDDQSEEEDDEDSSCTPMCQQMSLIEHPLSTMSLSRSISENITRQNERLPSIKSECNR